MTNLSILSALLVLTACAAAPADVAGQQDVYSVTAFGARGDGATDDTAAFQSALNEAGKTPGATVHVPIGNYMIRGHLNVPAAVTLEGVWKIPTAWTQHEGSTLLAVEGKGSEDGPPFITLNANSTIKGLTVFYPDQSPDDIQPYPWCVACAGGDNASIVDCLLVNPYQGVDFGWKNSGRHYIRNLYGQPLRRGIYVDKCYDIGRIENVHFWPFWTWDEQSGIREWLTENGEAFIFARTDWEYVFNTFVFGYGIGYRFIRSESGAMNGNLLGIGADAANIAVLVEQTQAPGLLITNGEFVSFLGDKPTEVVVKKTHQGVVQFSNCSFWGPAHQIARIAGTGFVSFNGCNFVQWDADRVKAPAIEQFGGDLIVNACNFMNDSPQLAVRGESNSAIFSSNRVNGLLSISNSANANLQAGLNVARKPPARPKEEKGAIVVDDADGPPGLSYTGRWRVSLGGGNYYLGTHWAVKGTGDAKAVFTPNVPKGGRYTVYAFFGPDPMHDHASDAPVIIRAADGVFVKRINLRPMAGSWVDVGTYRFSAGRKGAITFTNDADGNVLADAVKLVPK